MTSYYIRKLYQKRGTTQLQSSQESNEGPPPLLDCQQLLQNTCTTVEEITKQVKNLEILVEFHQTLVGRQPPQVAQLRQMEEQIFSILGGPQILASMQPSALKREHSPERSQHSRGMGPSDCDPIVKQQPVDLKRANEAVAVIDRSTETLTPTPAGAEHSAKGQQLNGHEFLAVNSSASTAKPAKPSKTGMDGQISTPIPTPPPDPIPNTPHSRRPAELKQEREQDILINLYEEFKKVEQDIQDILNSGSL